MQEGSVAFFLEIRSPWDVLMLVLRHAESQQDSSSEVCLYRGWRSELGKHLP